MANQTVFISYAQQDIEAARKIYQDLKRADLEPWLDEVSLLPGQKWEIEIKRGIRNCRYFLVLLSSHSVNTKGFVQKEITEALKILDEFPESSIYVIPVRLDDCQPSHEKLSELYPVDLFPSWEKGVEKLLRTLNAEVLDQGEVKIESPYINRAQETKAQGQQQIHYEKSHINILFVSADPTNACRLRLGEESREIQEKLKLSKFRDRFQFHQRMSVRPADLSQALLDIEPQIVHFSGHGTGYGELCFEDKTGKTHPIRPDALTSLFEQFDDQINCVVLNACYSETQANAIARKIDFVIGMNKEVSDTAAIAFSVGLYQALGAGRSIEDAYRLGCVQISLQGIPEKLTPVLIKKT